MAKIEDLQKYLSIIDDEIVETEKEVSDLAKDRSYQALILSENVRKIADYKGRFPTEILNKVDPSLIEATFSRLSLPTPQTFPYVPIANYERLTSSKIEHSDGQGVFLLTFFEQYREGLKDLEGFSNVWLVCLSPKDNKNSVSNELGDKSNQISSSKCISISETSQDIFLILVKLVNINQKKGEVTILVNKSDVSAFETLNFIILDMKVYLPYVEAHS